MAAIGVRISCESIEQRRLSRSDPRADATAARPRAGAGGPARGPRDAKGLEPRAGPGRRAGPETRLKTAHRVVGRHQRQMQSPASGCPSPPAGWRAATPTPSRSVPCRPSSTCWRSTARAARPPLPARAIATSARKVRPSSRIGDREQSPSRPRRRIRARQQVEGGGPFLAPAFGQLLGPARRELAHRQRHDEIGAEQHQVGRPAARNVKRAARTEIHTSAVTVAAARGRSARNRERQPPPRSAGRWRERLITELGLQHGAFNAVTPATTPNAVA